MADFRRKPVVVDAVQWFKDRNHPNVEMHDGELLLKNCTRYGCGELIAEHGWFKQNPADEYCSRVFVCPGSYIVNDDFYGVTIVAKHEFEMTYEPLGTPFSPANISKAIRGLVSAGIAKRDGKCPNCKDHGVYIGEDMFGNTTWLARDWKDEDDVRYDQPIDYCPFCGHKLEIKGGDEKEEQEA